MDIHAKYRFISNHMKKGIILWILVLMFVNVVMAVPPIPTEFYGTAKIYDFFGTPLPSGTQITAYAGNVSCGTFSIVNGGYYGLLSCMGDDTYTSKDEGAEHGQNIYFIIGVNTTTLTFGDTVWYYGEQHMVNISPIPACFNSYCELNESCYSCEADCGKCPENETGGDSNITIPPGDIPPNITTNVTTNVTGGDDLPPSESEPTGGGGGGGGTGGGGGGEGGEAIGGGGAAIQNYTLCQEDWFCSEWSPETCPIEELFERTCNDRNECGSENLKPDLSKSCAYAGTCTDGLKNQDETDTDCGGLTCDECRLRQSCIANRDCESNFCHPTNYICSEPTCNDEFLNQGEEDVDCGGPCKPCEGPTLEKPTTIAVFIIKGCGPFPWIFVLVSSIVTLLVYFIGKVYILKVRQSKEYRKLKKVKQLIRIYNLNRDLHAFVLIVMLLEIAIALYWYYLCELGVWLAIMFLIIIPLVVATLVKYYFYDEKRKKKKLLTLVLEHEDGLRRIIDIERREAKPLERKIVKILSSISYKKVDKNLGVVLKDIMYLIQELHETKEDQPFEIENSLADTISALEPHKTVIEQDESLKEIFSIMKLIERIHRDIVKMYKELREDRYIVSELGGEDVPGSRPHKEGGEGGEDTGAEGSTDGSTTSDEDTSGSESVATSDAKPAAENTASGDAAEGNLSTTTDTTATTGNDDIKPI